MSYYKIEPTNEELVKWSNNRLINPRTGRKITKQGKIYKLLDQIYNSKDLPKPLEIIDTYSQFRNKNIDPILLESLPIDGYPNNKYFKFKYKWDPYTGERKTIDTNGFLSFDPDTLVHYFYSNRMNYLWESSNNDYTGYYGDALGNGPDFEIKGRGKHPDWYLFRLPIIDCYILKDHCHQSVTMGPILNEKELKEIDKLAKKYGKNYQIKYKKKRPSLLKMYKIYKDAINSDPDINIDSEVIPFVEKTFINKLRYNVNVKAVEKLLYI